MRQAVPRGNLCDREWQPASRWWGGGSDRRPLEIDVMAASADGRTLLVGEAKLSVPARKLPGIERELCDKVARLPLRESYEKLFRSCSREHAKAKRLKSAAL